MPTQPFTLNDVSDMFDEYDMIQSDDSDLDDKSFIQEDTDSLSDSEWSTDDDGEEEEEEANEVGEEKMEHTSSKGLYLSSTMQNLLRRCAGSESDLRTMALLQDPAIQKMTSRRGSDSGLANSQESNLVCCVQTKSATEGPSNQTHPRPFDVLLGILKDQKQYSNIIDSASLQDFWVPWNSTGYTIELTDAVRNDDLASIRRLHSTGHHNLQCCNQFGESVVHTAARRGALDVLRYMVQIAGVSTRVCCDNGRNPLHDACWSARPNFACVRFLLEDCPDFLLLADKRGLTPLQYVPRDVWGDWETFLLANVDLLAPRVLMGKLVA